MKIEAVIFDMDGALIFTPAEYRQLVVRATLKDYNRTATDADIEDFWFLDEDKRREVIRTKFDLNPDVFISAFVKHNTPEFRKQYTKPYDDAQIALEELRQKGIKTGILTAAPREMIEIELPMLYPHKFNSVVRAQLSEGLRPKPAPDGLFRCLDELQVSREEAIYVGDGKSDMETSQAARVYGVWINREEYDFGKVPADLTITSLDALSIIS